MIGVFQPNDWCFSQTVKYTVRKSQCKICPLRHKTYRAGMKLNIRIYSEWTANVFKTDTNTDTNRGSIIFYYLRIDVHQD